MPLILPGNVASATAGAYEIANSCRFNSGDSAHLVKTLGTPTDNIKWTWSGWFKRSIVPDEGTPLAYCFTSDPDGREAGPDLRSDGTLRMRNWHGDAQKGNIHTTQLFRDVSAWYHLVVVYDSANATAGNRMRMYLNGTEITSFSTDANPDEDQASTFNSAIEHSIGSYRNSSNFFDGYMAEIVFIDGQALTPSSFGEFNEDSPTIWQPIDPSGLTFGDNGYWLDFEDSSALGNDVSGENNDWTPANLAAIDQCTDSPTNNFCTMNPLDNYIPASTFSEGNCVITTPSSNYQYNTGTFGLTAGLWYFEIKVTDHATGDYAGIAGRVCGSALHFLGHYNDTWGYSSYDGKSFNNIAGGASAQTYGDSWATNDTIIGVYIDLNANKLYFAKNGTVQNSGTGISITAPASVTNGAYHPAVGDNWNGDTGTYHVNFGNPTYTGTDQTDANGYGSFEYNPSTGTFDGSSKDFLAICTKNLAEFG